MELVPYTSEILCTCAQLPVAKVDWEEESFRGGEEEKRIGAEMCSFRERVNAGIYIENKPTVRDPDNA